MFKGKFVLLLPIIWMLQSFKLQPLYKWNWCYSGFPFIYTQSLSLWTVQKSFRFQLCASSSLNQIISLYFFLSHMAWHITIDCFLINFTMISLKYLNWFFFIACQHFFSLSLPCFFLFFVYEIYCGTICVNFQYLYMQTHKIVLWKFLFAVFKKMFQCFANQTHKKLIKK